MEQIIKQIIEIENRATQITDQAQQACENLPGQIEAELRAYEEALRAECTAEYEAQLRALRERTEAESKENERSTEQACARLQSAYQEQGQTWVKRLYESVTGNV